MWFILIITFILYASCSSPSALKGEWFSQHRECLLKDKSGRFKDSFGSHKKQHVLLFKENNQVQLIYPDFNVTVKEEQEEINQLCDVVIQGKYSISLFGGTLTFDFTNDETGALQVTKGQKCGLDQSFKLPQKLPEDSPYAKDPSVSLVKVNSEELHLGWPKNPKCEKGQLIFVFTRRE